MNLKKVLVVDDEELYRQMFHSFLTSMGYSCEVASNAFDALEKMANERYDLVISDIRMPGRDGVQMMMEAKKAHPYLIFIIMTGYAIEYSYMDIIEAGAADFISKPFEMGELKAKLERIEKERRILKQLEQANKELRQAYGKLGRTLQQTVNALGSAVEMRDRYTAGHQMRVAELACAIAREMGLSEDRINGIRVAGLIHDIGKVSVPAEILAKPSKLSELEMSLIKEHPKIGYEILKEVEFPWPIADIVLQHHERLNGSGYPQGLKANEIIFEAKVLAVADVVEAMASHRPYRPSLGIDKAFQEIRDNRNTRYDTNVVAACLRAVQKGCLEFV